MAVLAAQDAEFERRFLVDALPARVLEVPGDLIVQGYFVARDGVSLRVRATAAGVGDVDPNASERALLRALDGQFTSGAMTAKAPIASGVRYEAERELDPQVAAALIAQAPDLVVKVRRELPGGWFVDVFAGANEGLVVAEVERDAPIEQVVVPSYCVAEITDVADLSNARLSRFPYCSVSAAGFATIRAGGLGAGATYES